MSYLTEPPSTQSDKIIYDDKHTFSYIKSKQKDVGLYHHLESSYSLSSTHNLSSKYKLKFNKKILCKKELKNYDIHLKYNDFTNIYFTNYINDNSFFEMKVKNWLCNLLQYNLNLVRWEMDSLYFNNQEHCIASIQLNDGSIWHLVKQVNNSHNFNTLYISVEIVTKDLNNYLKLNELNIHINFKNIKLKSIIYNHKHYNSYESFIKDLIQENFLIEFSNYFKNNNLVTLISNQNTYPIENKLWNYSFEDREILIYRLKNMLNRKFLLFNIEEYDINYKMIIKFVNPFSLSPKKYVLGKDQVLNEMNEMLKLLKDSSTYNELPSIRKEIKLMSYPSILWNSYKNPISSMLIKQMDIYSNFEAKNFLADYYKQKQKSGINCDTKIINGFFNSYIYIAYKEGDVYVYCWMDSQYEYIKKVISKNLLITIPVIFDNKPIVMKPLQNILTNSYISLNTLLNFDSFSNVVEASSVYYYIILKNKTKLKYHKDNDLSLKINEDGFIPTITYDNDTKENILQLISLKENEKEIQNILQTITSNLNCYNCQSRISSLETCNKCQICLECFNESMAHSIDFDCFCGCQKKVKSFEKNILSTYLKHYLHTDIIDIINKQYADHKQSLVPLINQEAASLLEKKVLEIRKNPNEYPEYKIEEDQKITACLNCGYLIFKEEGCDAMVCQNCSSNFCAECMVQRKNFPCKCVVNNPSHFSAQKTSTYLHFDDIVVFPINKENIDYSIVLNNFQYYIRNFNNFTNYNLYSNQLGNIEEIN